MPETKYTFCRICEAACGLKVTVEGNRAVKIEPDKEHVVSKGYACIKGIRFDAVQYNPDRVLHPLKRQESTWRRISWEQAISEIGAKIKELVDRYGPQTVSTMVGNPAGFSMINPFFGQAFFQGLGSKNLYSAGSIDCNNKLRVFEEMYGSPFRLTYPDIDHTKFLVFIGANPAVSQMSFIHAPRVMSRLRAIEDRGGRVVFVDPRRIESARTCGEHVFIRPDTDVFFLLAFLHELIAIGGTKQPLVQGQMTGYETLAKVVEPWTAERAEAVTGIPPGKLRELVAAYHATEGAALYGSTGLNMGSRGTLAFWLLEAINAVAGNLDSRGGTLVGRGILDLAAIGKKQGQFSRTDRSRVGNIRSVVDTFPLGLLADEILTPGEGQITALIIQAGNPLLSCPNPSGHLEQAFRSLDLLVTIDLFRNETGNLAHYILPATTFLERADVPMIFQTSLGTQPQSCIQYADPVLEPPEDVRDEWWIFTKIAKASGVRMLGSRLADALLQTSARLWENPRGRRFALTPERFLNLLLLGTRVGSCNTHLREYPHGRRLPDNRPNDFLGTDRILTEDGKVQLAPPDFVKAAERLENEYSGEVEARDRLKLITKRERLSHNTWMHNAQVFLGSNRTTNYLYMHPTDADARGIRNGDLVEVRSAHGAVQVPAKITEELMPRAVALPHGWGHEKADGLTVAQRNAGVNVNLLAGDGADHMERLSGMVQFTGIPVEVHKIDDTDG
jgi:anaerobic selenocysteine-containing dehydrogenase